MKSVHFPLLSRVLSTLGRTPSLINTFLHDLRYYFYTLLVVFSTIRPIHVRTLPGRSSRPRSSRRRSGGILSGTRPSYPTKSALQTSVRIPLRFGTTRARILFTSVPDTKTICALLRHRAVDLPVDCHTADTLVIRSSCRGFPRTS